MNGHCLPVQPFTRNRANSVIDCNTCRRTEIGTVARVRSVGSKSDYWGVETSLTRASTTANNHFFYYSQSF